MKQTVASKDAVNSFHYIDTFVQLGDLSAWRRFSAAFRLEFGLPEHRLQMFGLTHANNNWPHVFGTSPFFKKGSMGLIATRGVCTVAFLGHVLWSLISEFNHGHWFMYLTHWSLLVQTAYFVVATHVAVKARSVAPHIPPLGDIYEPAYAMALPLNVRAMWLLFHLALPASLFVCLFYWMLINPVYKLSEAPLYMDAFAHGINFLLCFFDAMFGRVVFYLKYGVLFYVYLLTYVTFTIVHYTANIGTHYECRRYPRHECPIYHTFDWHNLTFTLIIVGVVAFLVVPVVSFMLWIAVHCRRSADSFFDKRARHRPLYGTMETAASPSSNVSESRCENSH